MSLSSFQLILDNGAAKVVYIYHYINNLMSVQDTTSYGDNTIWVILYVSFVLSTTILCTILIIYRIIKVVIRTERGREGIQSYKGVIEILVESASLYSFVLVLYIIFIAHETMTAFFFDIVALVIRVCLFFPSELKSLDFNSK